MATSHQMACVRSALKSLRETLACEYRQCALLSEGDVQAVVVQHLKDKLRRKDHRWIIGSTHTLDGCRPDVLCYYAPLTYQEFIADYLHGSSSLVAAIEIKWASSPKDDLRKLATIQRRYRNGILTWMVWGDHFAPSIHKANAVRHQESDEAIRRWTQRKCKLRGHTILRCGEIVAESQTVRYADRLRALRTHWWINDKEAKAALLASEL